MESFGLGHVSASGCVYPGTGPFLEGQLPTGPNQQQTPCPNAWSTTPGIEHCRRGCLNGTEGSSGLVWPFSLPFSSHGSRQTFQVETCGR